MAIASGLGKLYDIAYRFPSLEVHGNTYRRRTDDEKGLLAAFSAIIAFLEAEILITDNRATTAGEVLRHMRIEKQEAIRLSVKLHQKRKGASTASRPMRPFVNLCMPPIPSFGCWPPEIRGFWINPARRFAHSVHYCLRTASRVD
jgi:hypothetical protein